MAVRRTRGDGMDGAANSDWFRDRVRRAQRVIIGWERDHYRRKTRAQHRGQLSAMLTYANCISRDDCGRSTTSAGSAGSSWHHDAPLGTSSKGLGWGSQRDPRARRQPDARSSSPNHPKRSVSHHQRVKSRPRSVDPLLCVRGRSRGIHPTGLAPAQVDRDRRRVCFRCRHASPHALAVFAPPFTRRIRVVARGIATCEQRSA
jgi:hypothetical protein